MIELLVVIAIIAILIALLVPAVQKVREAAARTQCINNLKQIVLGMHMYHDVNKVFPPGYISNASTWNGVTDGSEATWIYFMLPYVEQDNLFRTVDYNLARTTNGFGSATATTLKCRTTQLSVFICPSDTSDASGGWAGYIRGNYAANGGIGPQTTPVGGKAPDMVTPGMFNVVSRRRMADITDGTSNTAFVSELLNPPGADHRGTMYYPEGPIYHHNNTPNSGIDQIRTGSCVNTTYAPCAGAYSAWNTRQIIITARSKHTGGVSVAMGDGTVRFASNSIPLNVWQALCTPQAIAGETVAVDF